jgi:SNF2 family DNA or RNA helicase
MLSLRAGGTGLNLAAATYVIHLDPWWNPAVEDQATDRAHRIGQDRPVTVIRMVARGTIEEAVPARRETPARRQHPRRRRRRRSPRRRGSSRPHPQSRRVG